MVKATTATQAKDSIESNEEMVPFNVMNDDLVVWSIDDGYGEIKADNGVQINGGHIGEDETLNWYEYFKRTGILLMPSHIILDADLERENEDAINGDPLSYIKVTYMGQKMIVGMGAIEQDASGQWIGDENKHSSFLFPALLATVLGLMSDKEKEMVDRLVMGLPVKAHRDQERHEQLRNLVLGKTHETVIELADGQLLKRKVVVNELDIKPQPQGSYFSLLYSRDGNYDRRHLAVETTAVGDIGTKTFNVFLLMPGFKIQEILSDNTNHGMMEAYRRIAANAEKKTGYKIKDAKLLKAIHDNQIGDYVLTEDKAFHYEYQAQIVNTEFNNLLQDSFATIQNFIWTGGGQEALNPYLQPRVEGTIKNKRIYFLGRFATATGLRNYGVWKEKQARKEAEVTV